MDALSIGSMKSIANARVVVIDDRPDLASKLVQQNGRRLIVTQQSPTSPMTNLLERPPHAVVIGTGVPKERAIDLCRLMRGTPALADAIIIVVGSDGRDGASYEADAFAAGADDFINTPTSLPVRLDALLRRRPHPSLSNGDGVVDHSADRPSITVGRLTIYELDYAVIVDGRRVPLTAGEFRILWKLAQQPGRTLTVEQLAPVDLINETYSSLSSVRSLIFSLRSKLKPYENQIQTVRRAGYQLME